jgi:hypothetical protein
MYDVHAHNYAALLCLAPNHLSMTPLNTPHTRPSLHVSLRARFDEKSIEIHLT